ncbi:MAG: transcription antitermination factor NusB [Treponema sp.]|jgi:N utilization substance protein B|nr:transcription antitermination factor NusB [Treponema sp.]
MASRRKGRILALQALYCWDAAGVSVGDVVDFSWLESEKRAALDKGIADFSRLLIIGTIENIKTVDAMIQSHVQNWDFSRLNRVDLAILRISTYTLMYQDEIAPSIVINEAIGISQEYGTGNSYRFINGVLDSIRKAIHKDLPHGA